MFPPRARGLQGWSVGLGAVLPLPGSSAAARDAANGPHQQAKSTVSWASPAARSARSPAKSVRGGYSKAAAVAGR